MAQYLNLEEVLFIHDDMVNKYGGSHGIRDLGLIQSAIARPSTGFGDFEAYPDIFLKAAVLGYSLLKNHAFIDGNKRTAITSIELFLWKNGLVINAKKDDLVKLALDIENNSLTEEKIAVWLKNHSQLN